MTNFWRIGGLFSLACVLAWAILMSGRFGWFVDWPSLLIVFGLVGMGLLAAFGPIPIMNAFACCLADRKDEDPARLAEHLEVFDRGYQLSWGAGFVGTLLGMVLMLQNMDDPSMIGPGMAVSLLSLLYGAALAEFGFNVLRRSTAGKGGAPVAGDSSVSPTRSRSMVAVGAAGTFMIVAMIFIMLTAMSPIEEDNTSLRSRTAVSIESAMVEEMAGAVDVQTGSVVALDD